MRAVVDTGIFFSARIRPQGRVAEVVEQWLDGAYLLVYSEALLVELLDVLRRPRLQQKYSLDEGDIREVEELVQSGELVNPTQCITACRDPKDNMVLEAAVAGRADVIVTGDNDLRALDPFEGIRIVGPAEFLEMLAQERGNPAP